jgi:isopenicillin N synthase-like dioxygenase
MEYVQKSNACQGINPEYATKTFEHSKRFFEQPMEKKMQVFTGLVPNEFVGYHPLEYYTRTGKKLKGKHHSKSKM